MSNQTTVILLAGGKGTRMKCATPKQFLILKDRPIAQYSFEVFLSMQEITQIVVVCEPEYRYFFQNQSKQKSICFALPGLRRQDSVYNGLCAIPQPSGYICVHDSARPFISSDLVSNVLKAAYEHGAATVGMPIKYTLKEQDGLEFVKSTPDRTRFWEIQTPQVIKADLFVDGFNRLPKDVTITDDVSLIEALKLPVKLVEGSYANIKITTQEDLNFATYLVRNNG